MPKTEPTIYIQATAQKFLTTECFPIYKQARAAFFGLQCNFKYFCSSIKWLDLKQQQKNILISLCDLWFVIVKRMESMDIFYK